MQKHKAASKWAQWNLFQLPNGSSFAFAKCKNTKIQKCKKVLNQFFKLTKKTHSIYFAAKNRRRGIGHQGYASPAFSISYGQAKEMATHYGSHLSNVSSLSFNIGWWPDFPDNPRKHIYPLYNLWEWICLWGWNNHRKSLHEYSLLMGGWKCSRGWCNHRKHYAQSP